MFAISIELLAGRYVATAYNDRDRVEWPPHPARLFSALLATWAAGADGSDADLTELAALTWLETLAAPEILASSIAHAGLRDVVPVFVPVNDTAVVSSPSRDKLDEAQAALAEARASADTKAMAKAEKAVQKLVAKLADDTAKATAVPAKALKDGGATGARQLPERRTRQPRTFPSATPACSTIAFVWRDIDAPAEHASALQRLLGRLARLGHSSTLVRAVVASESDVEKLAPLTTTFVPDADRGRVVIRWVSAGQCERLQAAFAQHQETEPRVLPASFVWYREGAAPAPESLRRSVFGDDLIVYARTGGPRLPMTSAVGVAKQLRRALMSVAEQPVAEMLSGHQPDGSPSEHPHLAIVPLPVVSGPHPDGAIIGIALVLPRACDLTARRAVMRAVAALEQRDSKAAIDLHLGAAGTLVLQRDEWGQDRRATLQAQTWTHASQWWATATPIALDRNPGDLTSADDGKRRAAFLAATGGVADAIARLGLPPPAAIDVVRSCVLPGSTKPRHFPRFPAEAGRPQRVLVHARIEFPEPVYGPLLVGAGRYHGLGLCLPLDTRFAPLPNSEES